MVRTATLIESLDAATDPAERSRLALEAVAHALRQINAELHWLDAQLYGRHKPPELRKLLERYAELESGKATLLQTVREFE